jgi:peroxiredoxin
MAQLESYKEEINRLGTRLVYIAAERRDGLWKPAQYLDEHPTAFPFLLDEDRAVTKAYGLYHAFGHDAFCIAHPATLIVDDTGVVRYIYRGDNQTDRAPVDQVFAALKNTIAPAP